MTHLTRALPVTIFLVQEAGMSPPFFVVGVIMSDLPNCHAKHVE
jgi:hypothetical protein